MILKKIIYILGLLFIMTFNFFCIEYICYVVYASKYKVFYLFFILYFTIMHLLIKCLDKLNLFNKPINTLLVLLSMFMSLGVLKLFLIYMKI